MRSQTIHNGDIIEYYDDQCDGNSYECVGCKAVSATGDGWISIRHTKNCSIVKKWKKESREAKKINTIVTAAFSKLTKKEIFALEKYYEG